MRFYGVPEIENEACGFDEHENERGIGGCVERGEGLRRGGHHLPILGSWTWDLFLRAIRVSLDVLLGGRELPGMW